MKEPDEVSGKWFERNERRLGNDDVKVNLF